MSEPNYSMAMRNEKRSPLKDKPLRNPGQSLDEKRDDIKYDHILGPAFISTEHCLGTTGIGAQKELKTYIQCALIPF